MMRRVVAEPRRDWQARVEGLGLVWHTLADGRPYWSDGTHYRFDATAIETIEAATAELYARLLDAGQAVLDRNLLGSFGIPAYAHAAIRAAWDAEPPALNHGRFDLGFDGASPPKLFEYNADTPTSLLETAVVQWDWLQERHPGYDQFNRLHDLLVAKWRDLADAGPAPVVHFTHAADPSGEDAVTVAYLRDTAQLGGIDTAAIAIDDIGWDGVGFVDLAGDDIRAVFHLYPWEWLLAEDFGRNLVDALPHTVWIEPIWKMIWSNKAILPLLWEMFPGHPNLLRAAFAPTGASYVRKPCLAREGANVTIVVDGRAVATTGGDYDGPFVYQERYPLPAFDGVYPVVGSWIVDGIPAGIGIREDGMITGNTAAFVPHLIT